MGSNLMPPCAISSGDPFESALRHDLPIDMQPQAQLSTDIQRFRRFDANPLEITSHTAENGLSHFLRRHGLGRMLDTKITDLVRLSN